MYSHKNVLLRKVLLVTTLCDSTNTVRDVSKHASKESTVHDTYHLIELALVRTTLLCRLGLVLHVSCAHFVNGSSKGPNCLSNQEADVCYRGCGSAKSALPWAKGRCKKKPLMGNMAANFNRDPYIIHLNIALQMVVFLYFGGKSHVSNGQMYLLRSPVQLGTFLGDQHALAPDSCPHSEVTPTLNFHSHAGKRRGQNKLPGSLDMKIQH